MSALAVGVGRPAEANFAAGVVHEGLRRDLDGAGLGCSGCPGGVRWGNLRGMGDAVKVIDWNGTDVPAGVAEFLAGLPPGRYRLAAVPDNEGDCSDLTAEEEEGIREGMRQLDAGEGVPLAVADARWQATLAAARKRAG